MVVLKYFRKRRSHQRFAKPDHVPNQHPVTRIIVEMMRGDLYRSGLVFEQLISEFNGDAKFGEAMASFLGEMISDLDVDVVGRDDLVARPTLLDNLDQLGGDIDAPSIVPLVFEPIGEFLRGIAIEDVNVQFSLIG